MACVGCRSDHNASHASSISRFEFIQWQKVMRGLEGIQKCRHCLEMTRCRTNCKLCAFAVCGPCYADDEIRKSLFAYHKQNNPEHTDFVMILPPFTRLSIVQTGTCNCLTAQYPWSHCSRCYSGKSDLTLGESELM